MKKRTLTKGMLMTALICGFVQWGGTAVHAEELQEFTLDPMVVTAQRMETSDLKTPANVEIVTEKEIKDFGYKNAFDVIDNQLGVTSNGYGDAGQDFGMSSGRTIIRGYDRGTLVMVDGIPMNLKNYNSLAGIPVDMIKKVEVLKGAAGTLYGAEAMGGVVNIITKRPQGASQFKVKGTYGNYYKDYGFVYSTDKMIISASKEHNDSYDDCNDYPKGSAYDWFLGKGQSTKANIIADLSDELSFNGFYQTGKVKRGAYKNNNLSNDYSYEDTRALAGLTYKNDDGFIATVGYNYRKCDGEDYLNSTGIISGACEMNSQIVDIQKNWEVGKDNIIAGYSYKRENFEGLGGESYGYAEDKRHSNSLYVSYDKKITDKFSVTFGLRGEKVSGTYVDEEIFNPQLQTLYMINDDTSWFTNIGRGFQTPALGSYSSKKRPAGDTLSPEVGWTYETGIKKLFDDKSIKFSVYHMDFKDKLGWSEKDPLTNEQFAINKGDYKNTGVEFEYKHIVDDNWSYLLGVGYGNPEINDGSGWIQDNARIDGVASVTYTNGSLTSSLQYKHLGDREYYKTQDIPDRKRLTWNTSYDITKNDNITVTLNNLLDHKNYANRYGNLDLPFNWRVMYTHTF